jgi:pyruvate kinase
LRRKPQTTLGPFEGDPARLRRLLGELTGLRDGLLAFEDRFAARASRAHRAYEAGARNLLHYIALRQHDNRALQDERASMGLSSLGRSESHVMATINAVVAFLRKAAGETPPPSEPRPRAVAYHEGRAIIDSHTEALLGVRPAARRVRIMVTLPSEASEDYALDRDILKGGTQCARINCAHDDAAAWDRMVRNIRRAERALGKPCRILMDLAGPKLRTGELAPGPRVLKARPRRDVTGQVIAPARVLLVPEGSPPPADVGAPTLPTPAAWLRKLEAGQTVEFRDARGSNRQMTVGAAHPAGRWVDLTRTAYFAPGLELCVAGTDGDASCAVGDLPSVPQSIDLAYGDLLTLTADEAPGSPARRDEHGQVIEPARVSCTLPEIFADVRAGERIWLDDGKIGGVIEEASDAEVRLRIVRAKPTGSKLLADKGINLPDSDLRIRGLTADDLANLPFIANHADLVALSFLRGPDDVRELQEHLARLGAKNLGIILKIETRKALEWLPAILLEAMRSHPVGVMIARGDLAVEVGYERLAEAQEEILYLCEASHLPVIWATQVLENLTKQGLPSRAEITDAAMSVRAECVMLNKGPYILESLRVLDDILKRMEGRQKKKTSLLGPLDVTDLDG